MANLYQPGRGAVSVRPANGTDFRLEELYALLECRTVQRVLLPDSGRVMLIDEDALIEPTPPSFNVQATVIAHFENAIPRAHGIYGKALICRATEFR